MHDTHTHILNCWTGGEIVKIQPVPTLWIMLSKLFSIEYHYSPQVKPIKTQSGIKPKGCGTMNRLAGDPADILHKLISARD